MEENIVTEVKEFIEIEHYLQRIREYIDEGEDLICSLVGKEEADLIKLLRAFTIISVLLNSYGYGEAMTSKHMRREINSLKRSINLVKRKHGIIPPPAKRNKTKPTKQSN